MSPATVELVFCHNCGHRNPPGVNFCSSCGAALATSTDTTIAFVPEEPSGDVGDEELGVAAGELAGGHGLLVVKRGPDSGAKYVLDRATTSVGRHPDSDIFLDDVTVSRRHAEFTKGEGGEYHVRDVGSLNGTYVNRERSEDTVLASGDEVQIGKFKLVFLAPHAG
ncbi:MAG: domain containing protein [Acidimicrobiaceae bacterium]|nr:domain containing protein [Acidimicrobiaceae bacterium]